MVPININLLSYSICTPSDSPLKKGGGLTNKAFPISKVWIFVPNRSLPIF